MTDLTEKTISTENIHEGKLVDLDVYTIETPTGRRVKREVVLHPGAVAIVPLLPRRDDQGWDVLMVRQYRTAVGRVMLEIPAGTLEPGEAPIQAANRELQEEVGYKPGRLLRLGGKYTAPGYTTEYIHMYLATDLAESALTGDSDEFIEVVRLPFADVLRRVVTGEIEDGKTIIGVLLAARQLDQLSQHSER
jgi:ADP-ribose pyrophosphatase